MRRLRHSLTLLITLVFALVLSGCLGSIQLHPPGAGEGSFTDGIPDRPQVEIPKTDAELERHVPGEILLGLQPGEEIGPIAEAINADVTYELPAIHAYRLRLRESEGQLTDALRALNALPNVRYAEPNYMTYELDSTATPNDPDFANHQYGPQIIGAPAAWEQGITGAGVIIAIIDTGVDAAHPDLVGKVLEGMNTADENYDTSDYNGHGTHVAGIAAANGNDGVGMAGIAWDASILPIKVFPGDSSGTTSFAIALGIMVAADPSIAGLPYPPADVANLSLGGPGFSHMAQDAVRFALEQNVVIVASMGNTYRQSIRFPVAFQGVIGVGASDPWDQRASFSTSGPHISVAAPGALIYSSIPGGGYTRYNGTSMASPHVSGAVALIRQAYPGLSPLEVRDLLERSADSPNGFTRELGHGRINVARALSLTPDYQRATLQVRVVTTTDVLVPYADLILYRHGEMIANIRSGAWLAEYEGLAWFYHLEPGDGYHMTVRLDEVYHGIDFVHVTDKFVIRDDTPITELDIVIELP